MSRKEITAGRGAYKGRTNAALQKAVDDVAAAGGGTVRVPPGVYEMHDALHVRNGVRVVGEQGAILRKVPSVSSKLLGVVGYGLYDFLPAEPEKFRVGMGVYLRDGRSGGFYDTVATIVARQGDWFQMSRPANHDYGGKDAAVSSVYPIVDAVDADCAAVEGLVLDGNEDETVQLNGCRGGGAFALRSRRLRFENLQVRHFNGDAISFQQCADVEVRNCRLHHCAGSGLHPGSGSVRYVFEGNTAHDNGRFGLFYCLRTTHSICRGNTLRDNGAAGISIGMRDSDHLIVGNTIVGNAGGVDFRHGGAFNGDRVRIERNAVGPNARGEATAEIHLAGGVSDVHVLDNDFTPAGAVVLSIDRKCRDVFFAGNTVAGRAQRAKDAAGRVGSVRFKPPKTPLQLGPDKLPLDGAGHLGVARLDPWSGECA